jgi:hypothetical protein
LDQILSNADGLIDFLGAAIHVTNRKFRPVLPFEQGNLSPDVFMNCSLEGLMDECGPAHELMIKNLLSFGQAKDQLSDCMQESDGNPASEAM